MERSSPSPPAGDLRPGGAPLKRRAHQRASSTPSRPLGLGGEVVRLSPPTQGQTEKPDPFSRVSSSTFARLILDGEVDPQPSSWRPRVGGGYPPETPSSSTSLLHPLPATRAWGRGHPPESPNTGTTEKSRTLSPGSPPPLSPDLILDGEVDPQPSSWRPNVRGGSPPETASSSTSLLHPLPATQARGRGHLTEFPNTGFPVLLHEKGCNGPLSMGLLPYRPR